MKKTGSDPDIALKGQVATSVAIDNGMWLPTFLETICKFMPSPLENFSLPREELMKLWHPADLTSA